MGAFGGGLLRLWRICEITEPRAIGATYQDENVEGNLGLCHAMRVLDGHGYGKKYDHNSAIK